MGARDVQGLPPLAQPAPRQSYAPMAGKPAPSSHEPPRQAEGTSELNSKLGEKGLMAQRSLSPNSQTRRHSPVLRIKKHTKAKQDPSAKRTTPTPHKCHKCCQTPPTTNPTPLNTSNSVNATRVQPQCPINVTNTLNATKMTGPNAS